MDAAFWEERWQKGQIGFHESQPNTFLRELGTRLGAPPGSRILVPLCGKSTDLVFLAEMGLDVTGVELVPEAVEAFFRENALEPATETWQGFPSQTAQVGTGRVRIALGSFLGLTLPEGSRFDAAYDRAALVAVNPEDRAAYAATLLSALRPGGRILLITFAYSGGTMTGPPFSVGDAEVNHLFGTATLEKLAERDVLESEPRFKERGATAIVEQAWLVTR